MHKKQCALCIDTGREVPTNSEVDGVDAFRAIVALPGLVYTCAYKCLQLNILVWSRGLVD